MRLDFGILTHLPLTAKLFRDYTLAMTEGYPQFIKFLK